LKSMMDRLGLDDAEPIESKMVSRAVESAQKRVEGNNFDARKTILSYDDVLREQREVIYKQRFEVIEAGENIREIIENMIRSSVDRLVTTHTQEDDEEDWNLNAIVEYTHGNLLNPDEVSENDLRGKDEEEIKELLMDKILKKYEDKEEQADPEQF